MDDNSWCGSLSVIGTPSAEICLITFNFAERASSLMDRKNFDSEPDKKRKRFVLQVLMLTPTYIFYFP